MEAREREVFSYQTSDGVFPFREWRKGMTDPVARATIDARLARLRGGNLGDSEPIGGGAHENKIYFGPGYRIYYATKGESLILLWGGDKSTQKGDTVLARRYWSAKTKTAGKMKK